MHAIRLFCFTFSLAVAIVFEGYFVLPSRAETPSSDEKPAARKYDPTENYRRLEIDGWQVLVNKRLHDDHAELSERTLQCLRVKLYDVCRVVREEQVSELRKIPIWIELETPGVPACACYHPDRKWLENNGYNPEKAEAFEISNAANFLKSSLDQPAMVLHELSHGYHHRFLGYDHRGILDAHAGALDNKAYQETQHIGGGRPRHYALTNHKEYFAETTEAYLGTNDFYPFVRAELKECDPAGYRLMEAIWGEIRR